MIGLRVAMIASTLGREEILGEDIDEGLLGHLLDVGPGGERLFRAGQDDDADFLVLVRLSERLHQFAQKLGVQGVQGIRTVQADQRYIVRVLDDDRLVGHEWQPLVVPFRATL